MSGWSSWTGRGSVFCSRAPLQDKPLLMDLNPCWVKGGHYIHTRTFNYIYSCSLFVASQNSSYALGILSFKTSGRHVTASGAPQSDTVALTRHESEQPDSWQLPSEWAGMALQAVIVCPCNNRVRRPTPPGGAAEIRWRWRSSPSQTCSAWLSAETLSPVLDERRGKQ